MTLPPPDEVLLGRGRSAGVDWELIYRSAMRGLPGPQILLRSGDAGGGGSLSEKLDFPLGGWGIGHFGPSNDRVPIMTGEVQAEFVGVVVECADGTVEQATIVDAEEMLGFNLYVVPVRGHPLRIVATTSEGRSESLEVRDPMRNA